MPRKEKLGLFLHATGVLISAIYLGIFLFEQVSHPACFHVIL